MFKEFKEFALKGNVLDMAIGIVIGAAFTGVVNSLVANVLTPPLNLLQQGSVKFEKMALPLTSDPKGPSIQIGAFIDTVISFLIVTFAVFLVVKAINRLRRDPAAAPVAPVAPTTRECPYCISEVPIKATKCSHCTSDLSAVGAELQR